MIEKGLILKEESQNLTLFSKQEKRNQVQEASSSSSTQRVLKSQWDKFESWCEQNATPPLPAPIEAVADYFIFLLESGIKKNGIESAKWAIDTIHKKNNLLPPGSNEYIKSQIQGIKRLMVMKHPEQAMVSQKEAFTIDQIKNCTFQNNLHGKRDKALLLLGTISGMRRSELSAIQINHIHKKKNLESEFIY